MSEHWIGVISAVAAMAAAVIAVIEARSSHKAFRAQSELETHGAVTEWLRELRSWADEAIHALADASYACRAHDRRDHDCTEELRRCQSRLSAIVDRGRFFLPNHKEDGIGAHKPSAYRGWRHAGLDPLVAAERVVSGEVGSGAFTSREEALIAMRREFVSGIQRILAPDAYNMTIADLVARSRKLHIDDKSLGGLLPSGEIPPSGADRLLYPPM